MNQSLNKTRQRRIPRKPRFAVRQLLIKYSDTFNNDVENFDINVAVKNLSDNLFELMEDFAFTELMYCFQNIIIEHYLKLGYSQRKLEKTTGIGRTTLLQYLKRDGIYILSNKKRVDHFYRRLL
jgi:hypothetical protein